MKKYELIQTDTKTSPTGTTLYRIRALKDFGAVLAGELGGYIESESNLSHYGSCWVSGNAQVSGHARVYDNAQVSGNARVYGNAQVSGHARVYDNAQVSGNARVYDCAQVYGNAKVYDNAIIQKSPTNITALKHNITITETHIFIGCEGHTIEHWRKNIRKIGEKHGYTDEEIKNTIGVLKAVLKARGWK